MTTTDPPAPRDALDSAPGAPREFPRYLYKISEATVLLSMSRSALYEQIRSGRLRSVRQGRARLVPAAAIREYVALLEREAR